MIVRQYAPCSLGRSIICLGKQGEINALRVEFDVSAWMAMYPDATVKLMHFAPDRPQDNPVIPTLGVEGTLRVWIVGEEDTAGAGNGVIELLLIDERTGSTIKSATGYTTVLRSPSAGIEAQEPEPGYVRYDVDQSALLTDTQKAFARTNIDAIKDEKDPTVPDWAKQPSKPTYTASEVGALPSSYTPPVTSVNGKTGAVALSAQDVGARPDTWTPSASDVGADAAGTASGAVAAHNVSGAAHADLRALIEGLTRRLNALADSDDTTLDQLSEIVAYIKSNKALIDAVTTGKVSVSDIVDNLTTNASGKVLSAAQGVALKAMIDGIVIPTTLPNPQPITINGQRYDGSESVTMTTVEIDDTLTQSGKAADAKAVGDQLNELNKANATQDTDLIYLKGNVWNAVADGGCDNTGVADCTDIVQSAINEAPNCSVLYFPKGNYLFKRNLVIEQKKGLKICGDGREWYGTLFTVEYDYTFIIIYGGEKITLENFSIKGNESITSRAVAFLDNTPTTMECRTCDTMVKNITITRFSIGIELSCPSGYNYFENIGISMFPSNGTGFSIGNSYKNTGVTDGGHVILPNYVYFTNCNVDGNNDNSYKIDGLSIKVGQYVVIDKCDFCNSDSGINIINNNDINRNICDIYVNNTSLYNNQNGVTINPFANGIQRISINNCMIVTNGKQYSYALAVYKRDGVELIKNISFIGNIMRDYSGVDRKYFNVPGAGTDTFLKIGLGC